MPFCVRFPVASPVRDYARAEAHNVYYHGLVPVTSGAEFYEMETSLRDDPGFLGKVSSSTPLLYLA